VLGTRTKNSRRVEPLHPLGVLQPVAQLHAAHTRLTSSAAPIKESTFARKLAWFKLEAVWMHGILSIIIIKLSNRMAY
jgi:hypothetical protein